MNLDFAIRNSYGVVRTGLLLRCGLSTNEIRRAVDAGTLTRLRHGWYQTADHDHRVATAVRAGGVLSCVSALELHGIWVPEHRHVHVRLTEHGHRRRGGVPSQATTRRCGRHLDNFRPARALDPILLALSAASACVDDDEFVAIVDSILHQRKSTLADIREALKDRPARIRRLLDYVDGRAESGTESVIRFRLAKLRVIARPQVQIRGVGRVDLLIGQRLVVEADSRAYHTDEAAYENDRSRDLTLAGHGYERLRLTYRQVFYEWDRVVEVILAMIRRRDHRFHGRHRGSPAWIEQAA